MSLRHVLGEVLPVTNAGLNAVCATLLVAGRRNIKQGRRMVHERLMLAAFGTSTLFLVSYMTRVWATGTTRFVGAPWLRYTYLTILVSHMLLAIGMLPMILRTLYLALMSRFAEHRRIARWTYPIWVYVSVTGVLVYVMLYHLAETHAH